MSDTRATVHRTILALLTLPAPRAGAVAWHHWLCAHTAPCADPTACAPDAIRALVYEYEAQANEHGATLHHPAASWAIPAQILLLLAARKA